jgi:hypothetical protein
VQGTSFFFFLFLVEELVVVVIEFVADPGQLKGFGADDLVLGSTFVAGNYVAFFYFVHLDIQIIFAFRAAGHGSLLSLVLRVYCCRMAIPRGTTPLLLSDTRSFE